MANILKLLAKNTVFKKDGNLVSLEKNYDAIGRLLGRHKVSSILDAGASHARISKRFMRMFPQAHVYAFEPQPLYKDRLIALANAEPRFHPYFSALSNQSGKMKLHITQSPGTTSLFTPDKRMKALYPEQTVVKETVEVDVVTIDEWASAENVSQIQFMKFDIQGGELNALRGASRILQSTLLIYIEVFFNPLYEGGAIFGEIDMCLRENGFALYNLFKPRSDGNGMLIQADAIYVQSGKIGLRI